MITNVKKGSKIFDSFVAVGEFFLRTILNDEFPPTQCYDDDKMIIVTWWLDHLGWLLLLLVSSETKQEAGADLKEECRRSISD